VDLFEAVGVDVAVNPRKTTAQEITRFTRERQAENVALVENDRAEVIEVEIDEESCSSPNPRTTATAMEARKTSVSSP
jgi:trk system potassium uptake protein TrkA